jgi:hypothetical protein
MVKAGIVPDAGFSGNIAVDRTVFRPEISWSNFTPLVFSGTPGQTQTGEITYLVHTGAKRGEILLEVTGTAFNNGGIFLDTQYRADSDQTWYKAGVPFVVRSIPGQANKLRFQATTGPKISSQHAGVYTAKLSVSVISMK